MSSYTSHLCINQRIREIFGFSEQFLLGGIMPDLLKDSNVLTRKQSHYIQIVENKKVYHIDCFCQENPFIFEKPYDQIKLGYLAHLIQDKIISEYLKTRLENVTLKDKRFKKYIFLNNMLKPFSVFKKELYSDYKGMEIFLLQENGYDADTLRKLVLSANSSIAFKEIIEKYVYNQNTFNNDFYMIEGLFLEKYQEECINAFQNILYEKRK